MLSHFNMDHLAPSSGVNWYTSYNAFGELLAATLLLPPMELGGVEVGRPHNPQAHVHYPTQVEGLHYGQEVNHPSVVATEEEYLFQEKILPQAQFKGLNKERVSVGEKISCQECGATFACGANLRNHMRIHTGERPFVCEECGASFTQRSNMRSHKRVHTGERPYMCGICGQTFARSSHLPGHMRTHTGEKPFSCPQCGRSFATNQIMKNHMRTHTGERPFVCDVCDATFAQSSCLATHKKIHTGERNFKCGKCGKAFISRSGLQTHERVHTGEKPYNCERCDKFFRTSSYLSKHRQKYCGNESFVKVNRQSDLSKAIKNPTNSNKLNKYKKRLKPVSRPSSKRTKRTQRPKRNRNGLCKHESTAKSEWYRLLEEDVNVTEKNDLDRGSCHDKNGSGTGDVLQMRLNSETVSAVYNQEEITSSGCNSNVNEGQVFARPLQGVMIGQNLDIKVEEESLPEESTSTNKTTTVIPQDKLIGDNEVLQVPTLKGENISEETEPFKQTFQDMKTFSKSQCSLSDSQQQVFQPQDQGTRAHLIENYFKEINSTGFAEGEYEEISSSPVMDVQHLPQLADITTASEVPQQGNGVKSGSALWYSRSYM